MQEEVFYTVTSYATDENVEPILVTSELSGSITDFVNGEPIIAYAEVKQGFSPIIYADVWARIDRPGNYPPVDIQLLDNGAGKVNLILLFRICRPEAVLYRNSQRSLFANQSEKCTLFGKYVTYQVLDMPTNHVNFRRPLQSPCRPDYSLLDCSLLH